MEINEKINEIIQQAKEEGAYKENFDAFEQEEYDQGFHDAIYFMLWNPSERSCSNCQYKNSRELCGEEYCGQKILETKIGGIVMALPKNYSIWLAVDYDGIEKAFWNKPKRCEKHGEWWGDKMVLPHGSVKKLIGRELSWSDEPVELKQE